MDWKFKKDATPVVSSDFYYDLIYGGYIKPENILDDEAQLKKLKEAIDVVMSFEGAMANNGLIEEM